MGALKRWKSLGGGEGGRFFKFTVEGQVLEGTWRGTREGKYGTNGQVELPDGTVVQFTLNVTLRDLVKVPDGTAIRITYRGMARAKNGNEFKAFSIQVEDGAEIAEDDEVPF